MNSIRPQLTHVRIEYPFSLSVVKRLRNLVDFFSFILQPSWAIADPICTFVFSLIVLGTTLAILKDALIVLMEGK